jgi:hypothetical protein
MQGKVTYIRPKVVGPFLEPCTSESYVRCTGLLFLKGSHGTVVKLLPCDHEVIMGLSHENNLVQKCRERL